MPAGKEKHAAVYRMRLEKLALEASESGIPNPNLQPLSPTSEAKEHEAEGLRGRGGATTTACPNPNAASTAPEEATTEALAEHSAVSSPVEELTSADDTREAHVDDAEEDVIRAEEIEEGEEDEEEEGEEEGEEEVPGAGLTHITQGHQARADRCDTLGA